MWKKFCVVLLSLVGTFSVVYAMNYELEATTNLYYGVNDIFTQTNKGTFTMGGFEWKIIFSDGSGSGYIMTAESTTKKTNCYVAGYPDNINQSRAQECMDAATAYYQTGANDIVGDFIKNKNANAKEGNLSLMSLNEYIALTKSGADWSALQCAGDALTDTYLADLVPYPRKPYLNQASRLLAWHELGDNNKTDLYSKAIQYVFYNIPAVDPVNPINEGASQLRPIYYVALPFAKKLSTYTSIIDQMTYGDVNTEKDTKLGLVSALNGTAPFTFTVGSGSSEAGDVDQNGVAVPEGTIFSDKFYINMDSVSGENQLLVKETLDAGTYYVKILIEDADYPLDQMAHDPVIVKVVVDKASRTITFDRDDKGTTTIIASITETTNHKEHATYTNSEISEDVGIEYSFVSGTVGLISSGLPFTSVNALDQASLTIAANVSGSAIIQAKIPDSANYKEAVTTKTLKVTPLLSAVYNEDKMNIKAGSAAAKPPATYTSANRIGHVTPSGGTSDYTYELPTGEGDNSNFYVDATGNIYVNTGVGANGLTPGSYTIKVKVTDSTTPTAQTTTVEKTITIGNAEADGIAFDDPSNPGTALTSGTYTHTFDSENNTFNTKILETTTGSLTGTTITFEVSPNPNEVITASGSGSGTGNNVAVTVKKASSDTDKNTVKIIATIKGGIYGTTGVIKELYINVDPCPQSVAFTNTDSLVKISKDASMILVAKGTITSSGKAGVGGITYTSSDETIATVDKDGNVTGIKEGTVTITATLNKKDTDSYDANYTSPTVTKNVEIVKGMTLTYKAETPNLKAGSNKVDDKVGTITIANNEGPIKDYIVSTDTTLASNVDAAFFKVVGSGTTAQLKLAKPISVADYNSHKGVFKVQVTIIDSLGPKTIDITVVIDEATNDMYFTDSDGNKIEGQKITKIFGENNNKFDLMAHSSNSGATTYQVDPTDTSEIVSVKADTGEVLINKVGKTKVQAVIGSSGGYEGGTISMDVEVTRGIQSIDFKEDFTTQQFSENGTFSALGILKETSLAKESERDITYVSNTPDTCTIDTGGLVTMLKADKCSITISNTDSNWQENTTKTKVITLYDSMVLEFKQEKTPQAETSSAKVDSPIGSLKTTGGIAPITYGISTSTEVENKDASFFKVNKQTGAVSLNKEITAKDLDGKYDVDKKAYVLNVIFTSKDGGNTEKQTKEQILITGAPLTNVEIDTGGTGKITKVYVKEDGDFLVDLLHNDGDGVATYRLKEVEGMPQDVIDISSEGKVSIKNANEEGKPSVFIEALIPASGGYAEKIVECEVEITKATQPFKFTKAKQDLSFESSFTLAVEEIKAKDDKGDLLDWSMISGNTGKLTVNYHTVTSKKEEGIVTVTASVGGDRNYKPATAKMDINITSKPAYEFEITVPEVTYGDVFDDTNPLKPSIFIDNGSGVKTRVWASSDPSVATIDENGVITVLKAGETTITCTQSIQGQPDVKGETVLTVNKKPITITVNDKEKYVGEKLPVFDVTIPEGSLVGSDTLSTPTFTCKDGTNNVDTNTKRGSYPINALYDTSKNPNYSITIKPGTLLIKQDDSAASWYALQLEKNDNVITKDTWKNDNVKVVLKSESGSYDELSLDKKLWDKNHITVSKEGINNTDVYFRTSSTHASASPQKTTIKIDKTKPKVTSITGDKVNEEGLQALLNKITFGAFFKPGIEVEIKTEDTNVDKSIQVSGVASIQYTAYVKENDEIKEYSKGTISSTSGKVKLSDPGIYRVCAIAVDYAGNESDQACSDLNVKKIDIDVDDDQKLDFNDTDNDGCADVNIKWKDEHGDWIIINGDRDKDGVPDLNIDSNGDGIADLNVDTDKDGKPDLNLVILTKADWKPEICVTNQPEEYCTGTSVKAVINIDDNKDNVPDRNIDTNGDMKADINIDKDNDKKPELNIVNGKKTWNPDKNFTYKEFPYDTEYIKPLLNVDTDNDGKADINIDLNGDGIPDINIDTDGDYTKAEINIDSDGDEKADINIDFDGDGEAEVNVEVDGDGIPDLFIDGDGDGNPDYNLKPNADGKPTENILILNKWTPSISGSKDGKEFNTMELKQKNELEDNGVKVEKPGGTFLPNYALKVTDAKDSVSESEKSEIDKYVKDGDEIKDILDVKMYDNDTEVQPDGTIRVKIPVKDSYSGDTIKVVVEQEDGTFIQVDAKVEGGYLIYDTKYLGKVSIIGEKETTEKDPTPDPGTSKDPENPSSTTSTNNAPTTSVKGSYVSGIGGAITGDDTSIMGSVISLVGVGFLICLFIRKRKKNN